MITLRELADADAPAVLRIYSGASLTYTRGRPLTEQESAAYVADAAAQARTVPRERWRFGIEAARGDLVGLIGLRERDTGHATVSYILREDVWGCGYGTEAVRRLVAYAFAHTPLVRLSARHHPDNPASGRVLLKAGFVRSPADGGPDGWLGYGIRRDSRGLTP
ncbi:GNAT family N-acetyltransferase [Streptomyces sp. NPDC004031]